MPYVNGRRPTLYGPTLRRGVGLSGFWDDLYAIGGKIQQAATAVREIKAGNAQVTVVPTAQGVQTYAAQNMTPLLLIGGGLLAAVLIASGGKKQRRRR